MLDPALRLLLIQKPIKILITAAAELTKCQHFRHTARKNTQVLALTGNCSLAPLLAVI